MSSTLETIHETLFNRIKNEFQTQLQALGVSLPVQSVESLALSPSLSNTASNASFNLEDQALQALGNLLNIPNPEWSSPTQCAAVLATLHLEHDIIAILATGSGKTMLALIPSLIEHNRITVVILSLRSLISDYKRKLDKMALSHEVYEEYTDRLNGKHNLLLVSADMARTHDWRHCLSELNERKPIIRMVFDEGHIPLTAQTFRQCLQNIEEIRFLPVQLVVLTGTVFSTSIPALVEAYGLGLDTQIFRTPTNRPELEYRWMPSIAKKDISSTTFTAVHDHLPSDSGARGLVFVSLLIYGAELAKSLDCDFYSGQAGISNTAREEMYNRWITGEKRVMVCTSAFGAGNDYSHVRLVVHVGTPFEMVDYVQEVSRGGRDKQTAICILLPISINNPNLAVSEKDYGGKQKMYDALVSSNCIRYLLTSAMDDTGVYCLDDGQNRLCSRCASKSTRYHSESTSSYKLCLNFFQL